MSTRDELTRIIMSPESFDGGPVSCGPNNVYAARTADAILAAGWRPPTPPAHAIEPERPTNMTETDELWALQKKAYQSTAIANELRARAAREDERAAEYRKQLGQDAGSECEDLAATLNDAIEPFYEKFDWHEATGIASTILAAGYRKPRTITTAEELDALPVGSAVIHDEGWGHTIAERHVSDGLWYVTGCLEYIRPEALLPATVLYEPEASK